MTSAERNQIVENTLQTVRKLLVCKGEEYGGQDALQNFRDAAALDRQTMASACWGMWKKHIVSIAEFVRRHEAGIIMPLEKWDEKLLDNIIYSMLMQCILVEETLERGECTNTKFKRIDCNPVPKHRDMTDALQYGYGELKDDFKILKGPSDSTPNKN